MTNESTPIYERRLILFLDFLGFREIVSQTASDSAALERLVSALNTIGRIDEDAIAESRKVTQFSDSVVVSYRVDEMSGVFWLLDAMAMTIIDLASRGYLLRGAVTVGNLYHDDRHVVGPAMVAAYEMESRQAIVPRVIIDPEVVNVAREHRGDMHTPKDEEDYVRSFIANDEDGELYFDYVSWQSVVEVVGAEDDAYGGYLARIGQLLQQGLQHSDPRVLRKYLRLHRHYTAAIDLFEAIPEGHPYHAQSPENCILIASLSRLEELSATASAAVADAETQQP